MPVTAADPFKGWPDDPRKQGRKVRQVTPSDTDELKTVPKALFILTNGNICVEPADGYEDPAGTRDCRWCRLYGGRGPDLRPVPGQEGLFDQHDRHHAGDHLMLARLIRSALLAITLAACSITSPADASRKGGFGFGFPHKTQVIVPQTPPPPPVSGVTYDTAIGNGVDANGFADLPLRAARTATSSIHRPATTPTPAPRRRTRRRPRPRLPRWSAASPTSTATRY
jgi:hypothetical protein